jgi:hypothetical protein
MSVAATKGSAVEHSAISALTFVQFLTSGMITKNKLLPAAAGLALALGMGIATAGPALPRRS